ncbi:UNVERIFIED_CONTAM: hypothetical protein FKN15_065623 [Acipenser sinensis]
MINVVLENSYFTFVDMNYKQIFGTAIGSKLGMHFASTYMGKWEEQLLRKSEREPLEYIRFVDDILGVWTHGKESLFQFYKMANEIHSNIKVDLRWTRKEIEFLDTIVKLEECSVETGLFCKHTDSPVFAHVLCTSDTH